MKTKLKRVLNTWYRITCKAQACAGSKKKGDRKLSYTKYLVKMKPKKNLNVTKNIGVKSYDKWYEEFPKPEDVKACRKTEFEVMELKDEAKKYLDSDTAAFNLKQSKIGKSDYSWMKTVLSKGTISDKVAAAVILIQDNPKYNLSRLENLVSMVKVSKKKQCMMIIDTLQEFFLSDLLHPERKLMKFEEQPFDQLDNKLYSENLTKKRQLLAYWYFEDQLKKCYDEFINALNTMAHDTVDANKEKAITAMYRLLEKNAEQEEKLLSNIVNKIGDPSSKVASKSIFCLSQLLNEHPNMKQVVLDEVEKLLFRNNISQKAQYYGICLLSQFVLDPQSKDVANNLIAVYFSFFKACLKKGEVDTRMMGALLMGVNRAYPFSEMDSDKLQEHVDTIYKVIHIGSFNVSLSALSLLHQIIGSDVKQSNRFYCALYKKLLDPEIALTTHQAMFLSLIFKVIKKDNNIIRMRAFIKRLLQISLYFPTNLICAVLYMISQIFKIKKSLYSSGCKQKDIANVSFKEESEETVETRDTTATTTNDEENNITLSNISVKPITNMITNDVAMVDLKQEDVKAYDPYHRNPLHSGSNFRDYTELRMLAIHFHPTVALFANTIIKGKSIAYSGDPLADFTMIRFLDRYVFKNPKKLENQKVLTHHNNPLMKRANYTPKGIRAIPVNSAAYLNETEDKIPAEELFLYRYLKTRPIQQQTSDDDDLESVNSEEFNHMLDGLAKDKDFEDLDVAGEIDASRKKRKKGDESEDDVSDIEDDEERNNLSDGSADENNMASDDLAEMDDEDLDEIDDEDLSDMDFDDEDDLDDDFDDSLIESNSSKKRKKSKYDENVFAAAEEFAELLEQEDSSNIKRGSANAMSNMDKAAVKQLDWEEKRHRWISGYNKTMGKSRFKGGSKKKRFKK